VLLLTTPWVPDTWAKNEGSGSVGNGGDVVICPAAAGLDVPPARLLDYVEGEFRGETVDLGSPTLSIREKVELAIERLERIDPWPAREIRYRAKMLLEGV